MTEISNPFSSGGGGVNFETRIQALFTVILLASGSVPCLPPGWLLTKIKLQGRHVGYQTDDFIAYVNEPNGTRQAKLLGQIKHTVKFTANDPIFKEVIAAAWTDFNDANLYKDGLDSIALLTGPLSASDTHDVRSLLDDARMSSDADDFTQKTRVANFFSKKKGAKLDAFRTQLENAKGSSLTDGELWSFLKSYHVLGFDLDYGAGVVESLARTLLRSNDPTRSDRLWECIISHVQYANQGSKTVQFSTLPSDILDLFASRAKTPLYLSQWLAANQTLSRQILDDTLSSQSMLAALLLGKWNTQSESDQQLFETLSGEPYAETQKQLRKVISDSNSVIGAHGNMREISNPMALWQSIGNRLIDADLEHFKEAAVNVLRTVENSLPHEEQSGAVDTKNFEQEYSNSMKVGVANTLAIIGSRRDWLSGCRPGIGEGTARLVVRSVLMGADWSRWASLNEVLPSLAEAAPTDFLDAVENAFHDTPNPFRVLLADEQARFYGAPRIYGLINALEVLAWNPNYLTRVTSALANLEELTPDPLITGNAIDALTKIYLPWFPQTTASNDRKVAGIQNLLAEHQNSGWRLLISVLPDMHQSSSGTHQPRWRKSWVPENWDKGTSRSEYIELVDRYASLAVAIAKSDTKKLSELLDRFDQLPPSAKNCILEFLDESTPATFEDAVGEEIWNKLDMLVARHRQFPDARWALPERELTKIESTAALYAPISPLLRHRRLFTAQEHRFYDGEGEYEEQRARLLQKRSEAVLEILSVAGMTSLWEFLKMVESPDQVGQALAGMEESEFDEQDLKNLLCDSDVRTVSFARDYVRQRFQLRKWEWIESLSLKSWRPASSGLLLSCLPFNFEVWQKVIEILGTEDLAYWSIVYPAPFQSKSNIEFAIQELLKYKRPEAALKCFMPDIYDKRPISVELAVEAFTCLDETPKLPHWLSKDELSRIFAYLQSKVLSPENLSDIEWKHLLWLDSCHEFRPLALERKLASDPSYFCELVRSAYKAEGEANRELSEFELQQARKAYLLFRDWRIPPGTRLDGSFDVVAFDNWMNCVDAITRESGHFDVAQSIVGGVLTHSPEDQSGLWLHRSVATMLNEEARGNARDGFRRALFNSRGAYYDSGGREEGELAAKYKKRANDVDDECYSRLATTLRELAQEYERDAV